MRRSYWYGLIIGLIGAGFGYYLLPTPSRQPPRAQPAPPPEVGVIELHASDIPLTLSYAGRVAGFRDVEVRAQIGGVLLSREYDEGAKVEKGQVLFRIDPKPFEVALDRAKAQLAQAEATQRQAEENFKRVEELANRQVSTRKQLDDAQAARDQARANVQLAQAEIRSAELNLNYTTVTAPVAGTTRLQSPPVGTLVQTQQTLLTTITQLDPAYVHFSFTDNELQDFRELNSRRAKPLTGADLTFSLQFGNGTSYPQAGKVDVAASLIDQQTGTIQARAIFPNPDSTILPGQFVRILVRGVVVPDAIVVPKAAVSQGPAGSFVYVVDANGSAQARPIRLGRSVEGGWIAEQGLSSGDRIIVDGIIRVRPGAPVKAVTPQAKPPGGAVAAEVKP